MLEKEYRAPWPPLHKAIFSGKTSLVQELISQGADVNQPDEAGISPLMRAAKKGKFKMIEFLLDAGADIHYEYEPGKNIFDWLGDNQKVKSYLLDYQKHKLNKSFVEKATRSDLAFVEQHMGQVSLQAKKDAFVFTPSVEVANLLLNEGLDANTAFCGSKRESVYQGEWCYPALAFACKEGYTQKAQWLVEHGADVNQPYLNKELVAGMANVDECTEYTPLMWAVENQNAELVATLVQAGACITAWGEKGFRNDPNHQKVTALILAQEKGRQEIISLLSSALSVTEEGNGTSAK